MNFLDEKGREIPPKSDVEIKIFKKYKFLLRKHFVSKETIKRFQKDLLTLKLTSIFFIMTTTLFSQSSIVTAGGDIQALSYTIGSDLVQMQIPVVKEVSLGVPIFEMPVEPKKEVKKKSFIEKIMEFFKKLINKNK